MCFKFLQCPIVERLTNSLMMHGRNNGKKLMAIRIVKHAFEIIHLLTGQNPLQVPYARMREHEHAICPSVRPSICLPCMLDKSVRYVNSNVSLFKIVTDAIINSGPREDSTRIGRAGTENMIYCLPPQIHTL